MGALDDLFEQTEDQPLPGGCDRCSASQTLRVVSPGVYVLDVFHDEWCPHLRSRSARSN